MAETHPVNVIKFCPKCGSSEFNPQLDNSFKCSECGFRFYYNAASSVAALILDAKGRLLLTRRAHEPMKGTLDLPGGFVSADESSEDALMRELTEELNCEVESFNYIKSYPNRYVYSGLTIFTNDAAFVCKLKSYDNLIAADDVAEVVWVDPFNLNVDEIGLESIRRMVKEFIQLRLYKGDR